MSASKLGVRRTEKRERERANLSHIFRKKKTKKKHNPVRVVMGI